MALGQTLNPLASLTKKFSDVIVTPAMPELPEIETLVREIRPLISGRVLSRIRIFEPVISKTSVEILERELPARKVQTVFRRGKFLVFQLSGNLKLGFHLGMTGQFLWAETGLHRDKHVHVILEFQNSPERLLFRDIRKFGKVFLANGRVHLWPEGIKLPGKDPFELSQRAFTELFRKRTGRIKSLLLNQRLMAGLGNIYADESLFEAGVHPRAKPVRLRVQRLGNLYLAIRGILESAIQHGGSSIDDYIHADGRPGSFQNHHKVYGRENEPCVACGALIRRIRLSGRSSFFCPRCQKL